MINWEDHVTGLIRIQDKCLNFDVDHEEIRVRLSDAMFFSEIGHVNKHQVMTILSTYKDLHTIRI